LLDGVKLPVIFYFSVPVLNPPPHYHPDLSGVSRLTVSLLQTENFFSPASLFCHIRLNVLAAGQAVLRRRPISIEIADISSVTLKIDDEVGLEISPKSLVSNIVQAWLATF